MPPRENRARTHRDRCPGVLAVHQAADGGLARIRLPGGVLTTDQLQVLAAASAELGDGNLELTSRANLQIRALGPGAPKVLSDRLYNAGLLPSITHERVRNILASPLSGLDNHSLYDVLPATAELDRLLCARPELAGLPGRFLFALDDGRGDLATLGADVGVQAVAGDQVALLLAGSDTGIRVAQVDVAPVMLAAAEAFLAERSAQNSEAWRLAELVDGPARILNRLHLAAVSDITGLTEPPDPAGSAGLAGSADLADLVDLARSAGRKGPMNAGTSSHKGPMNGVVGRGPACASPGELRAVVVAGVPLGRLGQGQLGVVAEIVGAAGEIRVTPWRSVVLGGLPAARVDEVVGRLEASGLVVHPESPWVGVTACAGRPGCSKALADVRGDALRVTPLLPAGRGAVHWSGCERRCGRPDDGFVDVVALDNGYLVNGSVTDNRDLGDAIAASPTS